MKMFKKYSLMFFYIKTIKKHISDIEKNILKEKDLPYKIKSIKIDKAFRIYTVLNFLPKTTKNIQIYGHMFLDNETKKFIKKLNVELQKIGLYELVGLSKADRIGENNILIVVEFKFINIINLYKKISFFLILLLIILFLL